MKSLPFFLLTALIAVSFLACHRKTASTLLSVDDKKFTSRFEFDRSKSKCNKPEAYIPDTLHPDHFYTRTIRINFTVVHDSTGSNNYKDGVAQTYLWGMVDNGNFRMASNFKMNLPKGNKTPSYNPHLSWKITQTKGFEREGGYYFVKEKKENAYFMSYGKKQNNYTRSVVDQHLVGKDSILNVFIISHPTDSIGSKSFRSSTSGISLGNSIKLGGLYHKNKENWEHATLLNHEIGHVFSLNHSWYDDGCEDTPNNANCYSVTGVPPCDSLISNNLMDYNNSQMAITPCQIGRMHMVIARETSEQRKFVVPDWCTLDTSHVIIISENIAWNGAKDMANNIIIKDGASLKLCCRVSMPKNSSITIEPGGQLILEEVKLHNACGDQWQGVIIQHKGKKKGLVEMYGKVEILNTEPIVGIK